MRYGFAPAKKDHNVAQLSADDQDKLNAVNLELQTFISLQCQIQGQASTRVPQLVKKVAALEQQIKTLKDQQRQFMSSVTASTSDGLQADDGLENELELIRQ